MRYIGLDIGGTKILAAAAKADGTIIRTIRHETPQDLLTGLNLLKSFVTELAENQPITAIGAATGGQLDWRTGVVSPLHQPQWRNVPLKQIMENEFNCPFWLDVDTNVAALGEYAQLPQPPERLVYLTISTGCGGSMVVNGKLNRGWNGAHPEIGHMSVAYRCRFPEKISCACGTPDCLEALISGRGIERIYGKPAATLDDAEWAEVAFNLGQGLRNIATLYAPELIILGGGVAVGGGEKLLRPAISQMRERLKLVPEPEVRLSENGQFSALNGAIHIARFGLA